MKKRLTVFDIWTIASLTYIVWQPSITGESPTVIDWAWRVLAGVCIVVWGFFDMRNDMRNK